MTAQQAFDCYYQQVFRFVCRLTRSREAAEDIAQECFLTLVRTPHQFDENRGNLRPYLFGMARNQVLKRYRDHAREEQLDMDAPLPGFDPAPGLDAAAMVERAVSALPAIEREAIILFQYEGFTLAEIGEIAGADSGTIKGRLHRARQRLRVALASCRDLGVGNGTK